MSSEWVLDQGPIGGNHQTMRVEAGAVIDEFEIADVGDVVVRYIRTRTSEGSSWECMFTVVAAGVGDLAIVHRLHAPTLADARRGVRQAVEFLAGRSLDANETTGRQSNVDSGPVWTADPRGNQPRSSMLRLPSASGVPVPSQPFALPSLGHIPLP